MTVKEQLGLVLKASRRLNLVSVGEINQVLEDVASAAIGNTAFILQENAKDPVSYTHLTLPTNREV